MIWRPVSLRCFRHRVRKALLARCAEFCLELKEVEHG